MEKIDLVIFDCDGVIFDSEKLTNTVLAQMLGELGLDVNLADMYEHFVGHTFSYCLKLVEEMLGQSVPESFKDEYIQRSQLALNKHLQPVTGIKDVLENLCLPYCLASNSEHKKINFMLKKTKLFDYFSGKIVSSEDVARGKPAPDIYLYAAKIMGVFPENCLVIEDSPTGVKAATAAGMTVFGYAEMMAEQRLIKAGAAQAFKQMQQLASLLAKHSD